MRIIDCRGLACPEPVLATRRALEDMDFPVEVRVDTPEAVANVSRMLGNSGFRYQTSEKDGITRIIINGAGSLTTKEQRPATVWLVTGATLGRGDEELGLALLKSLFHTFAEQKSPDTIYFLNAGVKLCAGPQALVSHLEKLQGQGWTLECCGTCLDFFELTNQLQVGSVTNMYEIVDGIQSAGKAITI